MKPKIIVFASGTSTGGGSGFENLVLDSRDLNGDLDAEIVAVVSNYAGGGVQKRADRLGVRFVHLPNTAQSAGSYAAILETIGVPDAWCALSGWMRLVQGLDPRRTFNIHPALLSQLSGRFGGRGMYGHHVHEAVRKALDAGEIKISGCSMHFVTDEYDRGPVFFERPVLLKRGMTAEEIGKTVNELEHAWQPHITNLVVHGQISWDGTGDVRIPGGYQHLP